MKRIGFYGGSFDPIHFGHINLSLELAEKHQLDKVFFCPANISPSKERDFPPMEAHHRLKMVELAIEDIKEFQLLDCEIKRGGTSFTVDTLNELKKDHPQDQLFLILGQDTFSGFSSWKKPEEILSLASPLVGMREGEKIDSDTKYYKYFEKGITETRLLDISSTEIRRRVQLKKYIRHLVPSKVVDYIYENRLYYPFIK